nr:ribonuclease H-like domain-containing protein [Tanacetum cinerariifolium]
MVVELKFHNEYLKSHFQDLKDVYADSAGSSIHAKEVDNDSKELKDKIEALNKELVIKRQTRGAAEATLEHLTQKNLEQQEKKCNEKKSELDSKMNRLHKRAKQQIQEVQKEKDDLEAKYKKVNEKSEQAASQLSGLQQELDHTRQHANEALKAFDTERQHILWDNIKELRHSIEPKENAIETLQQSLLEKEHQRSDLDYKAQYARCLISNASDHSVRTYFKEVGFLPEEVFEVREEFVLLLVPHPFWISESLDDMITGRKDGSSRNTYSKLSRRGLSSRSVGVIAMNAWNLEKISSSIKVPSMEWRILLPSSRRASKSSSKISSITSLLKQVSSFDVKKRSSQDERNFAIFFHFENNEIDRKGLSISRYSFAYKEYGIRLMIALRSTKALLEKVLMKLHGIRKLPGSLSFDSEKFMNVFMRIGFGSAIKLVSFDESQVVTFNSKFICGFRNSDCGTGSRSDNTVGSLHGFIIHWIVISKNIKKVTEVIDVGNWRVDNSWVLRWMVSLIEWNFSVSSTKSSIQSTFRSEDFKRHNKLMKLMQFLMGLDDSYMQTRSNILSRDPLPDAKGAFALISSEESYRAVITGSGVGPSQRAQSSMFNSNISNKSTFQRPKTSGNNPRPNNNVPRPNNNGNRRTVGGSSLVYEHCKFNGHTVDTCFKLIGYPSDFGKRNNSSNTNQNNQNFNRIFISNNNSAGSSSTFSDEQISKFLSFIKENSLNDKGNGIQANMASIGANQHLTYTNKDLVIVIDISYLRIKVSHPNGIEALITKDLMDVNIIGIGRLVNGLYYFDNMEVETVYMDLQEGYYSPDDKRKSKSGYYLFTKSENRNFHALLVYVDDIIITGNVFDEIKKFKEFLRTKFQIKDLGKLKYFLGIKVLVTDQGLCLSQRKYCLDLLSEFGLLACKPSATPIEQNLAISNEPTKVDKVLDNITEYQKLIGKLIYLTHTRPDISYSIHCLSEFMHKPLRSHIKIALKVLRYLKSNPGKGVHIVKQPIASLEAFVDADWAKCLATRKSVTGFCVRLNGSLIS